MTPPTDPRPMGMAPTGMPANNVLARLVSMDALEPEQAHRLLAKAQEVRKPVQALLIEQRAVDFKVLANALSMEFGIPWIDLNAFDLQQAPISLISEALLQKHRVLPLLQRDKYLLVALSDPSQTTALDEIRFQTNMTVEAILVDHHSLQGAIEKALSMSNQLGDALPDTGGLDELDVVAEDEDGNPTAMENAIDANSADDTPTVKFINKVIIDAVRRGASDLHFEPFEDEVRVRFRLDGLLTTVSRAPAKLQSRLAARLKVMSQLDIAERRVPQDGRMRVHLSKTRQMDFRVSTCPTMWGEKVVMRALDSTSSRLAIDGLGYEDDQKKLYLDALDQPYGMILVTGPTGSGKTVSLYAGLNVLNTDTRNISTAEDPVEIRLKGVNQVQVNPKKGMTFAAALKSFLRQDPDVIMVGEIRDLETAEIAIKAAQTGHLVLSTLHTNDAPSAITRLMNVGVAPYNITGSVSLVIAQRLARRLHSCKRPKAVPPEVLKQAGFTDAQIAQGFTMYEAGGCPECNEGYKGRVGIYQVMPMLENIQRIVLQGGNNLQIADAAREAGIPDLRESALKKVMDGLTSLEEVDRVTRV